MLEYILLILVGFGGGFIQRVSGFGLGIFVMMFLPYFLPSHTAAATVSCLFSCVTSTYNAIRYRKDVSYTAVVPLLAASLVTIPIAVRFAAFVSGDVFKILLGTVLILLSLYFLFFNDRIRIRPSVGGGMLAGGIGGMLNGLFSTGGPPVVLYLSQTAPDTITYFATIQFYFCLTNLYATASRAISGLVDAPLLIYAAVGMLGCMAGDYVGKRVFDKLDGNKLKKVIYIAMIISGVIMLF